MSSISGEITENGITTCNLTDYDGSTKYVVSADISAAGWKSSHAMNTEELYRDVTNIIIIFLVLIPVIIVIAAIICRTVVKGSFKALGTVSEAAEVMTRGDLSVKFDYSDDDEIGSVCRIIEQTNNTLRKYVNDISTHLDEMSHGDFTHAVTLDYTGDFAPIKASLNHIISELGGVFSDINDAAAVVYSGAGNVSQGAASLAESASKQTSLVDEISDEVASTDKIINDNVKLTDNTRELSGSTSCMAEQGNAQMKELLNAIAHIRSTSEKIQEINGTIGDIAFQTNILALNASIEAARAGAAGKQPHDSRNSSRF